MRLAKVEKRTGIHGKSSAERIDWLFDLTRGHGEASRSAEAWLPRERYLAKHPTASAVLKWMDRYIKIPVATNTTAGKELPLKPGEPQPDRRY